MRKNCILFFYQCDVSPSPVGNLVVSLFKLFTTANIFETGFPGIFQACRSIPGQEEFNKYIPRFPDVDGDHSLTFVTM
jgi:hypothetical protein